MIREYKTSIKPIKDSYTIGLYEFNIIDEQCFKDYADSII